ncbi:MAG: AmmeMemoRadiSam system radical SAM enzyme [Candidatus Hydrogenedentes bacterium]|nr:AmmeMemoRadiSam system radical SAM enzyme [Candidatus Hydrogenedentota bacterium]
MIIQCDLCPKRCLIAPGQSGECRIRMNLDGKLVAVTYGRPCAVHVDPIEKKPLFHMLPGSRILSIATVGCNLHCKNCQNWEISQENPENIVAHELPPRELPGIAASSGCKSIAYTYTEPIVFYEYTLDGSITAHEAGLKNAMVTAGYINSEPLKRLLPHIDAANIDLKAMSDDFYQDICDGSLAPVLNTLEITKAAGVWVEVTNLVIPTLNDSDADLQKLCRWVASNLGPETPLHFSRFYPAYRMKNLPPTPGETLDRAREIAKAEGLYYVYIGNVSRPGSENTYCHQCGAKLITRRRYTILENKLREGACPECGTEVPGLWQ